MPSGPSAVDLFVDLIGVATYFLGKSLYSSVDRCFPVLLGGLVLDWARENFVEAAHDFENFLTSECYL